jgi:hypothetical protein
VGHGSSRQNIRLQRSVLRRRSLPLPVAKGARCPKTDEVHPRGADLHPRVLRAGGLSQRGESVKGWVDNTCRERKNFGEIVKKLTNSGAAPDNFLKWQP